MKALAWRKRLFVNFLLFIGNQVRTQCDLFYSALIHAPKNYLQKNYLLTGVLKSFFIFLSTQNSQVREMEQTCLHVYIMHSVIT